MALQHNPKFLWALILLLVALNLVSLGTIWNTRDRQPAPAREPVTGRFSRVMTEKLQFDSGQLAEFEQLLQRHRSDTRNVMNQIRAEREDLRVLLRRGAPAPEAGATANRIGQLQTELELLNYRHFAEIMAICDDRQKEELLEIMQNAYRPFGSGPEMRHERRHGRREGRAPTP
jgi:periplasmic protein CpxP/Spy